MNKKKYENPELVIIYFDSELDTIGVSSDEWGGTGDEGDMTDPES